MVQGVALLIVIKEGVVPGGTLLEHNRVYFPIVQVNISNVTTVLISVKDAGKYGFILHKTAQKLCRFYAIGLVFFWCIDGS